ncbi:hypothetical protein C7M84_014744 [Penaeus vannamei]|uniref:C2H2-type domain-containing protein n=1 Tax=Penaeus vannamei TaxID=6689 RepID=A0A423SSJ5_PENVA|nr:hypothetical protein C7M84_014744 [Penaeus vannamei]
MMEANRRRVPGHHDTSGRGAPDEVHFPCPDCEQVFNTFTDLRHHCFVGHMGIAQEAHVCTLCSKTFSSSSALKVHVETIHDRKHSYKCEECHETFNKKTNMQNHLRRVHQAAESKRLQCDLCRQEVPVSSELRKHVERVHLKCAPARSCVPSAGSPSATPGHEVHLSAVHNKDTQYPCPACSMVFYRLNDHGQPQAAHARGKEVRTHVCPTCSKGFCSNSDLRTHINVVHQDVRKHVCDVCDKAFKVASHLTYHKRKHTGETRLPVSVLQQGLRGPGNISEHRRKLNLPESAPLPPPGSRPCEPLKAKAAKDAKARVRSAKKAWRRGGQGDAGAALGRPSGRRLAAAQNAIHFTASEQAAHTVASTQASIHSLAPVNASTSAVYSFIPYIATTGHADVIQVPSTQVLTPTDGSTFHATPAIVASQGVIDHVNAYINF